MTFSVYNFSVKQEHPNIGLIIGEDKELCGGESLQMTLQTFHHMTSHRRMVLVVSLKTR